MKTGNLDGQGLAELRNYNIQNLSSAPTTNLSKGRVYFNTSDNKLYVYDGTQWIDATSQGNYTFTNGTQESNRTVSIKLGTSTNATLTANSSGLSVSVANASESEKGVIEIATDSEATAGTDTTRAINAKQLATKVSANASITAGTGTVITYDSKGLITGSSNIGIDSGSTNYLTFSSNNIGAKVDTTVTNGSTKLITSGAVATAISGALTGALIYQGTWTATGQTDYSSISLPVKKGYMYAVSGTATISGVEWNSGDYLVINKDVASGGTITSADVDKIDNTEGTDIVRLNATQTITNKTIDADNNTIQDLTTSNLKSGVLQTTVRAVASASDTAIPTEKAVASALAGRVYSATNGALTSSGGVCTWTITHNMSNSDVNVSVYEVSTGDKVMFDTAITSANVVTVKILSASSISAGTYKAVIMG